MLNTEIPPPTRVGMPFGKHRGWPVSRVPRPYLIWVLRNVRDMSDTLREVIRRQADADGSLGLLFAILDAPDDKAARVKYAEWLAAHGEPERAAVVTAFSAQTCLAYARKLERSHGYIGLAWFSALQNDIQDWGDKPKGTRLTSLANVEYATLLGSWRKWLPESVTTLSGKADRDAFNRDYINPAITFPSRRRENGHSPLVSITFSRGLPVEVECDRRDWERCGLDMITLFPWIDYTRECRA
jgi:uncharacterized protein (TIGR02996 family)